MSDHDDKSGTDSDKYQRPEDGADAVEDAFNSADVEADAQAEELSPEGQKEMHEEEMQEPEVVEANDASADPAPVQKMPSRVPGYLGLLLGLCGLGLAGYLYFLTQLQDPLAPFEKRIDELAVQTETNSGKVSSQTDALRQEMQSVMATQSATQSEQSDTLRAELAAQQEDMEAATAALAESLGESITAQPPTSRDWKLAEVEYLLRIANHRLLMERDPLTAGQLLATADGVLAGIGDFSLFDVRARLADEILSVKSMTGTDLQGLYLQIEALKKSVKALPLRPPEYTEAKVAPGDALQVAMQDDLTAADAPTAEQSVWQELGGRLSAFFQYRKIDGNETRRPLLSPDESIYLEMNLRLMLERSQLALMRRNQLVYEQSLTTAEEWIGEYLDGEDAAVAQTLGQIVELLDVQLELPIPDISGSLKALEAVSRGRDNDSGEE